MSIRDEEYVGKTGMGCGDWRGGKGNEDRSVGGWTV